MLKTSLAVGLALGGIVFSWGMDAEGCAVSTPMPAGEVAAQSPQGWVTHTKRQCARLFFFRRTGNKKGQWGGSPGEIAVEYGLADWKAGYMDRFRKLEHRYWRLGRDHWTNLDATAPVVLGGVAVEPGYYYVAVHLDRAGKWFLELLDPEEMRRQEIDAWHLNRRKVPAGIRVPLRHREGQGVASALDIRFHLTDKKGDRRKARLEIRFGPHRLTTPVLVKV